VDASDGLLGARRAREDGGWHRRGHAAAVGHSPDLVIARPAAAAHEPVGSNGGGARRACTRSGCRPAARRLCARGTPTRGASGARRASAGIFIGSQG